MLDTPTESAKPTTNEKSPCPVQRVGWFPPTKDKPFHGNPSKEKHSSQEYLRNPLFANLDMDWEGLTLNSKFMDNVLEGFTVIDMEKGLTSLCTFFNHH